MLRAIKPINRMPSRGTSSPTERLINSCNRVEGVERVELLRNRGQETDHKTGDQRGQPDGGGQRNDHEQASDQIIFQILLQLHVDRRFRSRPD